MKRNVDEVADRALELCEAKGWKRGWSNGGCYLHLEVSEFIEALRGKGDESPTDEAADVLFVLFSMLRAESILISDVVEALDEKCSKLLEMDHVGDRMCRCAYGKTDKKIRHDLQCPARRDA